MWAESEERSEPETNSLRHKKLLSIDIKRMRIKVKIFIDVVNIV